MENLMTDKEKVSRLINMGKIPRDAEMSDQQFKEYDSLICSFEDSVSFEDAEQLIGLFSDDCDDLNWGLVHLIETAPFNDIEKFRQLIAKCPSTEYREILEMRYSKSQLSENEGEWNE